MLGVNLQVNINDLYFYVQLKITNQWVISNLPSTSNIKKMDFYFNYEFVIVIYILLLIYCYRKEIIE